MIGGLKIVSAAKPLRGGIRKTTGPIIKKLPGGRDRYFIDKYAIVSPL